jgi:hypothetical protein
MPEFCAAVRVARFTRRRSSPKANARREGFPSIRMSNSQNLAVSRRCRVRALRRRDPLKRGRREGRVPARTRGPRATKNARGRTTGVAGSSGLPCAMVLRLIRDLPGDHRLVATVACVMRSIIADLAPASERQDHTTSPSAKRSFVRIPRKEYYDRSRPPLPASTSVTIAIRPSARGGMHGRCG